MRILLFTIVAFSMSFAIQAQNKKGAKQTTTPSKQPTTPKEPTANGKVGYLDIEEVIVQLPEYKQLELKLEETTKKLGEELQAKRDAFQNAYAEYMQNAKSMPDSTRTKMENKLQQMDYDIQQFQQNAQNTFSNTRKLFLGPVYLRLGGVIRDVAVENGFSMILPYRVGEDELLLHSDTTMDVSRLVVKKFATSK